MFLQLIQCILRFVHSTLQGFQRSFILGICIFSLQNRLFILLQKRRLRCRLIALCLVAGVTQFLQLICQLRNFLICLCQLRVIFLNRFLECLIG